MTSAEFVQKWAGSTRTERAASQEHFIDLCRMIGVPTPNEADPSGSFYAFEKGAEKTGGGDGFADVWHRGFFAWEYKGKRKDLGAAYQQLLLYREALENPPLLVVCDLDRFEVHTNFTNTPATVHTFTLDDLASAPAEPLRILRAVMQRPDDLKPGQTREELTAEAARQFASIADRLRGRGEDPHAVAHFLNKLLFCLFAEDVGLLPEGLVRRLAAAAKSDPKVFSDGLRELFGRMSNGGGLFGVETIQWFNGGLFDGDEVLDLTPIEIITVDAVSRLDWSQVEPAVFGTLFERGLDPNKRSQLGAHYTDRESIMRVIDPVLMEPLRRDFAETQEKIEALLAEGKRVTARTPLARNPQALFHAFLDRLRDIRVLDPACGSGNFLYLALQALKDLERDASIWASGVFQMPVHLPAVGPEVLLGIELNDYAAELARVVIWIGEIQWMIANGFSYRRDPILRPLKNIETRDAVVDLSDLDDPREPEWPPATVIIGNPPFLGGKLLRSNLGDDYVDALFRVYDGRVPREADLVAYWHEKARAMVASGAVDRVGLLATQGIRGGANRRVLERIKESGDIFLAWSDEPWVVEGANVHVSVIGYDDGSETSRTLDGSPVAAINANLTAGLDLTTVRRLAANAGVAFMGDSKGGPFDIDDTTAQKMLKATNPHGRPNTDVVRRWVNGKDLFGRPRNMWLIDFGVSMPEHEAALYEAPYEYVKAHVKPEREKNKRDAYRERWWIHVEPRSGMRKALKGLPRFLATTRHAKHRIFEWLDPDVIPDSALIVFARSDDYFFGVLQSRVHEVWARGQGTQVREVESGFRYTPTTTFETFPLPEPTQTQRQAVADAAAKLHSLRSGWLRPSGRRDPTRTLTQLYNENPTWLQNAHRALDEAVHLAYGWPYPLGEDTVLARLLALNLSS